MARLWVISFLLATILLNFISAESLKTTAVYEDGNTCVVELNECSIEAGNDWAVRGQKGERGPRGDKGDIGNDGVPGIAGPPGPKGSPGDNGLPGKEGQKGEPGLSGAPGGNGETGLKGDTGPTGLTGSDGAKGDKGDFGPPGPPGAPGLTGTCPCVTPIVAVEDYDAFKRIPVGTISNPAQTLCKSTWANNTGDYLMGPGNMLVRCEMEEDKKLFWTCVPPKTPIRRREPVEVPYEEQPYWLSSKNISIEDIYGLNPTQLGWFQEKATIAKQKIIYHCKNSAIYDPAKPDSSLLLLSWNDILFDRKPQENTPFVYIVPVAHDHCSNTTRIGEARTSMIVVRSDFARRLPVVDFKIRDLRDRYTDISLEHAELCFH